MYMQSGVPGGLVSGGLSLAATTASCFLFGVTYRCVEGTEKQI